MIHYWRDVIDDDTLGPLRAKFDLTLPNFIAPALIRVHLMCMHVRNLFKR